METRTQHLLQIVCEKLPSINNTIVAKKVKNTFINPTNTHQLMNEKYYNVNYIKTVFLVLYIAEGFLL